MKMRKDVSDLSVYFLLYYIDFDKGGLKERNLDLIYTFSWRQNIVNMQVEQTLLAEMSVKLCKYTGNPYLG